MNEKLIFSKLNYLGDVDWYKLTTKTGTTEYTISFSNVTGPLHIRLYDHDGNLIIQSNSLCTHNGSIKMKLRTNSTYYLQISSVMGYYNPINNPYSLNVS
ncbi:MAG: Bacterial pre-peptidase C-terminal domain [Herbinix sp.]|jgi:hypothetical protein|nr:Bacterial pre-peptidase C-terminal domain [Herbinix sp.]